MTARTDDYATTTRSFGLCSSTVRIEAATRRISAALPSGTRATRDEGGGDLRSDTGCVPSVHVGQSCPVCS